MEKCRYHKQDIQIMCRVLPGQCLVGELMLKREDALNVASREGKRAGLAKIDTQKRDLRAARGCQEREAISHELDNRRKRLLRMRDPA